MTFATKRLFSLQASGSVVRALRFTQNYDPNPCYTRTYVVPTTCIELVAIQTVRNGGSKLIGVLVGNKSDQRDGTIDSRSEVTPEAAEAFAKQLNLPYFEASAVRHDALALSLAYICPKLLILYYRRRMLKSKNHLSTLRWSSVNGTINCILFFPLIR